jgi:uncharacterized repeat protein (TIGR01451 family)
VVGGLNVSNAGDGYPSIAATPNGNYFVMMSDSGTRSNGNIEYYQYNGVLSARKVFWDDATDSGNLHPSIGTDASTDLMVAWTAGSGAATSVKYLSLVVNPLKGFMEVSPAVICEHQTFTVSYTVSNTGTLPVTGLSAVFGTGLTGGDASTWQVISSPAMPAQIDPDDHVVLTWTVSATGLSPLVTGSGWASFNSTVSGTYLGMPVSRLRASPPVTQVGPPKMSASMDLSSTTLSTGQLVTLYLTVTDEGGSAVNTVTPIAGWNQVAGGVTVVSTVSGPDPASANLVPGSSATFSWVYQVVSAGTPAGDFISFSSTASGIDAGCGLGTAVSALSSKAVIERAAVLDGSVVSAVPSTICSGDLITITQTVTNTGAAAAKAVVPYPALTIDGPGTVISSGSPAGVPWLAGGASTTFTWTYFGNGAGQVKFTATTTANDSNSLAPISTGPSPSTTVEIIGVGTISVNATSPAFVSVGQWFSVVMTASNPGSMPLLLFQPDIAIGPGSALVVQEGPSPVGGASIPPGGSIQVSWTYSAAGAGPVRFTVTGTGVSCGGAVVEDYKTVATLVQTPANLATSMATAPGTICRGVPFQVNVVVTNTGQATCAGLAATQPLFTGTAAAVLASSPSYSAILAGGASRTITWNFIATQGGTLQFSDSVTGFDANSGRAVAKTIPVSPLSQVWNGGALSGMATGPGPVSEGQPFTVAISITNTGDMNLMGLQGFAYPRGDSAPANILAGPMPAGPVALAVGGNAVFTWVAQANTEGTVILTLTAAGFDGSCTSPFSRVSVTVPVVGPHLVLEKSAPSQSSSAEPLTYVLTLRNNGGDTAYSVVLADTLPAPLVFVSASGTYTRKDRVVGWNAGSIPPGGVKTFRVTARVLDKETDLTLSNTAWATFKNWNAVAKPPVYGSATVALVPLLVKRAFPNPYNWKRAVRGTLKFSGIPTGSAVRIYTTRGLLAWEGKAGGGRHTVEWDGKNQAGNRVSPGVYLAVLEGADGNTVVRVLVE